jgi:acetyl-CoA carboxylase carboxyl transferase subunit beta
VPFEHIEGSSPVPISDWFRAREQGRYTTVGNKPSEKEAPDGVWSKCAACRHIVYQGELAEAGQVCPHCGHHFELGAGDRVALLADEGSFKELDATLTSDDPLSFDAGGKSYPAQLRKAKERTGLPEAVVTGKASIARSPVVLAVMDRRFIGASMGSAVGERIARAMEVALAERRPLVLVTASGGARMQEGMLSLMQMAKTAAVAERLAAAGVPRIAVLTDPTYGGVTASFATLADVILAEPGARIGFAGPVVIEQTIRQSLPKGFQTAESLEKHGMIDAVVARSDLRETLETLLRYLQPRKGA